ncbi:MAG: PqqD family protein [Pseudomonadota bacterium]
MAQEITLDSVIRRTDNNVSADLDDQVMMMDLERGTYFAVSGTAKAVWDKLESPAKISAVVAELTEAYDVSEEDCARDVVKFVTDLVESDLAAVCD